jgi:hypothetical protein
MLRKCLQTKCTFNIDNEIHPILAAGCPLCRKCKATSNIINQECGVCLSCEGEEGASRRAESKPIEQEIMVGVQR